MLVNHRKPILGNYVLLASLSLNWHQKKWCWNHLFVRPVARPVARPTARSVAKPVVYPVNTAETDQPRLE